jgi:hypothetical protein
MAMTPGLDNRSSGPIHGRVTYNGRPLDGGYVLFEPMDRISNDWAVAPIERDGTYAIDSKWQRQNPGKERFGISVVPKSGMVAAQMPSRSEGANPDEVPMSPDSAQSAAVSSGFPSRFTNVRTSGLHVTLGREPARVDIDLKD